MVHCRKKLGESEAKVFLEFFLETNTLCHQLQAEAFEQNTERLVNDLTRTSKSAEEKLEVIEERSDEIIKESNKVRDTLSSIEIQALEEIRETVQKLAQFGQRQQVESLRDYSLSWVFDDEVADKVDSKVDPTYVLPPERTPPTRRRNEIVVAEEVGENFITTSVSQKYNLRPRK